MKIKRNSRVFDIYTYIYNICSIMYYIYGFFSDEKKKNYLSVAILRKCLLLHHKRVCPPRVPVRDVINAILHNYILYYYRLPAPNNNIVPVLISANNARYCLDQTMSINNCRFASKQVLRINVGFLIS